VKRTWAAGVATVVVSVLATGAAHAQSATTAADDLCNNNVTFEDEARSSGFLTSSDLAELDRVALGLQGAEGFFKVVVLGSPPKDDGFAGDLLDKLGGSGRVIVYDPTEAVVASNVDTDTEASAAEQSAMQTFNVSTSLADATTAAAQQLAVHPGGAAVIPPYCTGGGGSGGSGSSSSSSSSSGGGLVVVVVLVLLGVAGLMAFVLFSSRKRKRAPGGPPLGEGERKVRAAVDDASNLVIDLSDRVEEPSATAEAKQAYNEGAAAYADLQDELEQADTRAELEAVYPKLVECRWKLETAKALLDGQAAPARPEPEPLFPPMLAPPVPTGGAVQPPPGVPEPAYRSHSVSPWLTTAAVTAMSVLMSKGMGGRGGSNRPPSDDGWFNQQYGGGMGGGSSRPPGGFHMGGGGGRGMGRRR
jgi:hypothetical protein